MQIVYAQLPAGHLLRWEHDTLTLPADCYQSQQMRALLSFIERYAMSPDTRARLTLVAEQEAPS